MKRQSISLILIILHVLLIFAGCGSSSDSAKSETAALQRTVEDTIVEDVIGVFEGLEDNHTAVFSFNGAEKAFYFEDSAVEAVLFEAALGSSYTLSYSYDEQFGYVIYKISE